MVLLPLLHLPVAVTFGVLQAYALPGRGVEAHIRAKVVDGDFTAQKPFNNRLDAKVMYDFPDQWFQQPLDHFDESVKDTWNQRFWVNLRHYKPRPGAPVIVVDGGETSGEDRLPYLDTGVANILAKATGGIGVVLEHRYYGKSLPVLNFSTDSLRWLNNAQAAADSATFMRNVKLKGIQEDITAPNTPWIYYGGSYAGARAAHMRILYPEITYGAIASSAVTHAQLANWEYMTTIRDSADPHCADRIINSIATIDRYLRRRFLKRPLKALFGLSDLTNDEDFVSVLERPLGQWQNRGWETDPNGDYFDDFCTQLAKPFGRKLSAFAAAELESLPFGHERRMVAIQPGFALDFTILNYAKWIKEVTIPGECPKSSQIAECFGASDSKYQNTNLDQSQWRPWLFQVCTEWGFFTTAPPDQNEPSLISRLITLEYKSQMCHLAFPPGEHFRIPDLPNITVVNELGGLDIAADRLAFIDGEVDPWRPYTTHSHHARKREDTMLRPFKLIPGGVHHWDASGYENIREEPPEIQKIHREMIEFVLEWLKDWKEPSPDSDYTTATSP